MTNMLYFIICILFLFILIFIVAFLILIERKVLAISQRRIGPAILGRRGFFQIIADVIKPLFKEIYEQKFQTVLAVAFGVFLLFFSQIVYAIFFQQGIGGCLYDNIEFVLFIQMFMGGLTCIGVLLMGYLSGTKYAMIGATRLVISEISTDTSVFLTNILFFYSVSGFDYESILIGQEGFGNICLVCIIYSINHILQMFISAQRAPLDLIENEGELVAGYNTEFSGPDVLTIYFSEYFHLFNAGLQFIFILFGIYFIFIFDYQIIYNIVDIYPDVFVTFDKTRVFDL